MMNPELMEEEATKASMLVAFYNDGIPLQLPPYGVGPKLMQEMFDGLKKDGFLQCGEDVETLVTINGARVAREMLSVYKRSKKRYRQGTP